MPNLFQNLILGICMTLVPVVHQNAAFFEVCLDNNFLLFLYVFDGFGQEGGNKFEYVSINLRREIFVEKIEDSGMFRHVVVDKG